jgi:hypothetical protein
MSIWGKLAKYGGLAGAIAGIPFTGGMSLATTLPWLTTATAGLGALGAIGGALSSTKKAKTSTSTPIEPPEFAGLRDMLIARAKSGLAPGSALPAGFIEGGIGNINRTADASRMNLDNSLTARGLSSSPIAGAGLINQEIARQGRINRFQNVDAPAYDQQLQQQNFTNAAGVFDSRRTGTESVGAGPGPAGGAFMGAAEILAKLYGSGRLGVGGNKKASGINPVLLPPDLGAQRLPWNLG